jgi:hypothetical protein
MLIAAQQSWNRGRRSTPRDHGLPVLKHTVQTHALCRGRGGSLWGAGAHRRGDHRFSVTRNETRPDHQGSARPAGIRPPPLFPPAGHKRIALIIRAGCDCAGKSDRVTCNGCSNRSDRVTCNAWACWETLPSSLKSQLGSWQPWLPPPSPPLCHANRGCVTPCVR